jgi:hypothetical protein
MNIFKKLFNKNNEIKNEILENNEVVNDNTGNDTLLPIIKNGLDFPRNFKTIEGNTIELPDTALPIYKQVGQTELSVIIGIDKGENYEWVLKGDTTKEVDEIIKNAYQSLISKDDISIGQIEENGLGNSKIGILQTKSGFASSYILVEAIWEKIFKFCDSDEITFIIPTQNNFLFCSSNDVEFMTAELFLIAMTEYLPKQDPKPLSNEIFVKTKGKPIKLKNASH